MGVDQATLMELAPLIVVDHPVVADRLAQLRDRETDNFAFRRLTSELSGFVAYEALRDLATETVTVATPVAYDTDARRISETPLLVPILRAGLGMVPAIVSMLSPVEVAHVGLRRDEETLRSFLYLDALPASLTGRRVVVCDPMLATGGTLVQVCDLIVGPGRRVHPRAVSARLGARAAAFPRRPSRGGGGVRGHRLDVERRRLHRPGARRRRRPAVRSTRLNLQRPMSSNHSS